MQRFTLRSDGKRKSFPFYCNFSISSSMHSTITCPIHALMYLYIHALAAAHKKAEFSSVYSAVKTKLRNKKRCFNFGNSDSFHSHTLQRIDLLPRIHQSLSINFTRFSHFSYRLRKFLRHRGKVNSLSVCFLRRKIFAHYFSVNYGSFVVAHPPVGRFFTGFFTSYKMSASLGEALELEQFFIFYRAHLTSNYIFNSPRRIFCTLHTFRQPVIHG